LAPEAHRLATFGFRPFGMVPAGTEAKLTIIVLMADWESAFHQGFGEPDNAPIVLVLGDPL
jgi:hypothetical protein